MISIRDREDTLVGLLPLMSKRRLLSFIGSGISDYLDILVREGWEDEVAAAFNDALRGMDSWLVADLRDLRPEAAAWRAFEGWSGSRLSLPIERCPATPVRLWDEMLVPLSKNKRKLARRAVKRSGEDGFLHELARPEDAGRAARTLVDLHRESWRGRGIDSDHLSRRFERFLEAAARRMVHRGLAEISERWLPCAFLHTCFA